MRHRTLRCIAFAMTDNRRPARTGLPRAGLAPPTPTRRTRPNALSAAVRGGLTGFGFGLVLLAMAPAVDGVSQATAWRSDASAPRPDARPVASVSRVIVPIRGMQGLSGPDLDEAAP
jgi:hypothetical protein